MLGLRKGLAAEKVVPRHVEIWGQLVESNQFLRKFALVSLSLSFAALAMGTFGLLAGLYWPRAFFVDSSGQASYVGRLKEQMAPTSVEVRYVAKEFFKRFIAMNSLTVESDLSDAWNLMTNELRAEQEKALADFVKQSGEEFVSFVKKQGIQTEIAYDAGKIDVQDHNGKVFTVRLVGDAKTWPLGKIDDDASMMKKEFEAFVTLVKCPRTEQTPSGLLVHKITRRFYVDESKTVK